VQGIRGLRVVHGGVPAAVAAAPDPERFEAGCVEAYIASWVARGFSPVTVDSAASRLERVLATVGKPAWEATREDLDRVVGAWAAAVLPRQGHRRRRPHHHRDRLPDHQRPRHPLHRARPDY
jgi:hypothetical protein